MISALRVDDVVHRAQQEYDQRPIWTMQLDFVHAKREMRRMDDDAIAVAKEAPQPFKIVVPGFLSNVRVARLARNDLGRDRRARSLGTGDGYAWKVASEGDELLNRDEPGYRVTCHDGCAVIFVRR